VMARPYMKRILFYLVFVMLLAQICGADVHVEAIPADLVVPPVTQGMSAPGKRVRQYHTDYVGSDVYHLLYLPTDWKAGETYPVIVEYAGNKYKTSLGTVEGSSLGYGISGGKGAIWVCLPFVDKQNKRNATTWWGDVDATVAYCKDTVRRIGKDYGGDPNAVVLAGFSRGAIACNYIGLRDSEIASLWCGFICHSHYDGVLNGWPYTDKDRISALGRLKRLGQKPQLISDGRKKDVDATHAYLKEVYPAGQFTFLVGGFLEHTDTWVLRDIPARKTLREWFHRATGRANHHQ
jgi:hypothetical protein